MIPNNSNNNSSEFCYLNISIIYKNFWFPDRISIILSAVKTEKKVNEKTQDTTHKTQLLVAERDISINILFSLK